MGTCSTLVFKNLLEMLMMRTDCKVVSYVEFDDNDLYQAVIEHDSFDGYVGQYCVIMQDGQLSFRRDMDT